MGKRPEGLGYGIGIFKHILRDESPTKSTFLAMATGMIPNHVSTQTNPRLLASLLHGSLFYGFLDDKNQLKQVILPANGRVFQEYHLLHRVSIRPYRATRPSA